MVHNICARCETRFDMWSAYYIHHTKKSCIKVIRPVNTSGRSKEEIVKDVETTWLKEVLL
jgi:hypothetical protein